MWSSLQLLSVRTLISRSCSAITESSASFVFLYLLAFEIPVVFGTHGLRTKMQLPPGHLSPKAFDSTAVGDIYSG
jgi:hypothetical protein